MIRTWLATRPVLRRASPALALALAIFALPTEARESPVVKIDSGRIEGVVESGAIPLRIFRGIPFAAPPVGDLRWREPQPVAPWRGVRQATQFGARCMQAPLYSDMMFRSPAPSEDCLYANVWTPTQHSGSTQSKLPVLLYFYGGGFMAGDGSEKRYEARRWQRAGWSLSP
jgi:para-nitrobenzyl esterase